MPSNQQKTFGRFRLDPANERLWLGEQPVALRPKPFAVLRHLVEHRGELVTKQQLLDSIWPSTFVTDAVLKDSIRQVREALGDDAAAPQYIETAHRRGYRFIAQLSEQEPAPAAPASAMRTGTPPKSVGVLGRATEPAKMQAWLERALAGERQIVFVTGEPGIGKTTVVNALVEYASAIPGLLVCRGQCLEQYGAGEAYLPVLEGLSRLGRTPDGPRIVELLRRHAPAWLGELASLLPAGDREALQRQGTAATRERMLREMAEAMDAITVESPLIVVVEDLHWSDYSTLDLIGYLARRRDPARLMVIGTYRPVDVTLGEHPLKSVKRELQAHGLCQELPLGYLSEEAVAQFLGVRFPGHHFPRRLARLVHRRSEGNPLFMVHLADYLADEGIIVDTAEGWQLRGGAGESESGIPESIRQLIEKQIDRLDPEERMVLEGASVVGMECSTAAIGAGLDRPTDWVEQRCDALVRRHEFLSPARLVELPDGTITPRYTFNHVLYLEVLYRLLPVLRRSQIHLRIGHCGELFYRERAGEIAAELAMHFEQGLDSPRAVKYLLQSAENATHRSAHHEAERLARRGLRALDALPATPERDQQELGFLMILGVSLMSSKGFAAAELEDVCSRALVLCARRNASPQAFKVERLLGLFHYFRAEMQPSLAIVERLLQRANDLREPRFVIGAHCAYGVTLVDLGRFEESIRHLDEVPPLRASHPRGPHGSFPGQDPEVTSDCYAARALWTLGYPDQALARIERALSVAGELAHTESLIVAAYFAAHVHQLRGEASAAQEQADVVLTLAEEYGLAVWIGLGRVIRGWALVTQAAVTEGLHDIRRGLDAYEATGARLWRPYFLGLLAQALVKTDRIQEGLSAATDALALIRTTGEQASAAELHRVYGELLLATGSPDGVARAEESFGRALAIAREQRAKSWELKAATSLCALARSRRDGDDRRRLLREIYDWFKEGDETADLKEARRVLAPALIATDNGPRSAASPRRRY
jgi:DNA-binding winged helix-turn-helix (wHTH) protein/predicted ATPase